VDPQRKLALFRRLRYDALWTIGSSAAVRALADPEDGFLISAALEAQTEFLATWDGQLLEQGYFHGERIVSPDELIALIVRN
jgi:predicted nucleic acid-binding protein